MLFQLGLAVYIWLGNCEGLCANYWQPKKLRLDPQ